MSEKIYVDTNVYIDYLFNRKDKLRPIGDFAFELFRETVSCSYTIVFSDWNLAELQIHVNHEDINELLKWFSTSNKIETIKKSKENVANAKKLPHWQDALHEILAKKGGAKYLVTRNLSDFSRIRDPIQIKFPEELI